MNAEQLIPFCISGTKQTLSMMAATEVEVAEVTTTISKKCWGDVTGFIGLTGTECTGNFAISFSENAVLGIVGRLLMDEFTEINEDVLDAVGELTNMISGQVKKELLDRGHLIDMASPVVIQGSGVPVTHGSGIFTVHQIRFTSDAGEFVVEVCFRTK
jgi:chemotaxis protein CheX